ncbi:hypothetical protein PVAP13_6KG140600 [Panicum virgatum]|uniref:Uncharacterized protein n=1 Tax=Panicum virgatum TaxID=38727 RepID=A0A8T0RBX7_PANVG|nr:hypothetical protein PVAP13_6KG140600 [Panicum virgatum]
MMRGGELRDGARPPGGEQRRDGHARPSPAGKKVLLESGLMKTYVTKNDYCLFSGMA